MKKLIALYGIIAGAIPGISFFLYMPTNAGEMMNMDNGMLIGYTVMIVSFSTIFIAISQYRNKYGNGHVSFGKSFIIALGITLISSIIYAGSWEAFTSINDINFAEQYREYENQQIAQSGDVPEVIMENQASNDEWMDLYERNFAFRFGMTMMEIIPVGIVLSLIAGLIFSVILKKKSN